nr:MAG TPA: hypothetical protein [Caudoviricetes sp.]
MNYNALSKFYKLLGRAIEFNMLQHRQQCQVRTLEKYWNGLISNQASHGEEGSTTKVDRSLSKK